jgi:hypothetical protein
MLGTYKAVIQGNQIEWVEDVPNLGNQAVPVFVTVLEEQPVISADSEAWTQSIERRQKMVEILEKLAGMNALAKIKPVAWQRETRQDRSLLHRD